MNSTDIFLEIIDNISSIEDLQKICSLNKHNYNMCKYYSKSISKKLLDIFQVDYTDPSNFIYIESGKKINDYGPKDDNREYNYKGILKIYMKYYYETEIKLHYDNITSFPIYPNMIKFYGIGKLTSFPIQPKMKLFQGWYNQLTSFPIQPMMEEFIGNRNQLTSFPIQPNMKRFRGDNNQLTSFPIQPKMTHFFGDRPYQILVGHQAGL